METPSRSWSFIQQTTLLYAHSNFADFMNEQNLLRNGQLYGQLSRRANEVMLLVQSRASSSELRQAADLVLDGRKSKALVVSF